MEKKTVFMIMPFKDEFFEVYEMLKVKFEERFEFTNAGDEGNQQNILKDIIQPIYEADVIIADLTGLNANVMYELGLAHCFNKKTIIITQDDLAMLPFDLKQYRAKDYNTHFKKFAELVEYLEKNLNGAVDNSVSYSNPVKDFLTLEKIENASWFSDKPMVVLEDDSDKGFLDYLADIEENTQELTDNLTGISAEMSTMNAGVSASTAEVERAKKSGGASAVFVRKESRKIAKYTDTFSAQLRARTKTMSDLWDKIERDTLGLLENKHASNDINKPHLVQYLKALFAMKESANDNEKSFEGLKTVMENTKGFERSLNKAIAFLISDLDVYLVLVERIQDSVDKILSKSKFVVGDINDYSDLEISND